MKKSTFSSLFPAKEFNALDWVRKAPPADEIRTGMKPAQVASIITASMLEVAQKELNRAIEAGLQQQDVAKPQ